MYEEINKIVADINININRITVEFKSKRTSNLFNCVSSY